MCCHGCQAVAAAITGYGLDRFYERRAGTNRRPAAGGESQRSRYAVLDQPVLQRQFVSTDAKGLCSASLTLEDIVCPACCWLIETRLRAIEGIEDIAVNFTNHRALVRWDPARTALSRILEHIARLGYAAYPSDAQGRFDQWQRERRAQLRRIGIAGLLGMQVMMLSAALYFGDWQGMEADYRRMFHWTGLFLTLPVLCYSARPFFARAIRDLRLFTPGMDVPVALALTLAFAGSAWATLRGAGGVYYDSIVMFVFLLLLGRYVEFSVRRRGALMVERSVLALPSTAIRIKRSREAARTHETVPAATLDPGDIVLVRAGSLIPADGRVEAGSSTVNESLITGESRPVFKEAGAEVIGGSINLESPLEIAVTRTGSATTLSAIRRLVERGLSEKPGLAAIAGRVSTVFIGAVLILAGGVAWHGFSQGAADWFETTLSVLVVACPCALALATPATIAAATGAMLREGVAVVHGDAVDALARASCFVFDKTGTLTRGALKLVRIEPLSDIGSAEALAVAAALEKSSEHPIALAITGAGPAGAERRARNLRNFPGRGLSGEVDGRSYFIGTPPFIAKMTGRASGDGNGHGGATVFVLADEDADLCRFAAADEPRPDAGDLIAHLHALGRRALILSGDSQAAVEALHRRLGTDLATGNLSPEAKREQVRQLIQSGEVVAMVGDGVNDAPVLAAAHVAIAMAPGTDLARNAADAVLLNDRLDSLRAAVDRAIRARRIVNQNIAWAIAYNLCALPAAAAGWVAPWMAALGMSLSSLLVVGNSARAASRRRN